MDDTKEVRPEDHTEDPAEVQGHIALGTGLTLTPPSPLDTSARNNLQDPKDKRTIRADARLI